MTSPALDWIDVPDGWFVMGGGPRPNALPAHRVFVSAFRLARAPVTRCAYQAFVDATGHGVPDFWHEPGFRHPRAPAVGPSWDDAMLYCTWLHDTHGTHARLPSEAEWERAALADRDVVYPWGDREPETLPDYHLRWTDGPEPVDAYPSAHPWGFLGLCENVHEWCSDWYDADYYSLSPERDPRGPSSGRRRASRGGSWRHQVKACRITHRSSIPPHMRYSDYGFRLAADRD